MLYEFPGPVFVFAEHNARLRSDGRANMPLIKSLPHHDIETTKIAVICLICIGLLRINIVFAGCIDCESAEPRALSLDVTGGLEETTQHRGRRQMKLRSR